MRRRKFLERFSLSAAALVASNKLIGGNNSNEVPNAEGEYMGGYSAPPLANIRAAFIGVGARGGDHLQFFASLPNTEVVAISDLYQDNVEKWKKTALEIGAGERHQDVAIYHGREDRSRVMLQEVKSDVVFIATNWSNHAPMAIESMNQGAHAFVEVPIAVTLDEMWAIVNTSERTRKHCMMMENVNYSRDELMFLNRCRQGVIGELLHAEAAYIHELRWQMEEQQRGTGSWRTLHYARRNGNLYPTHGLGPVAQYMNIARQDDNFKSLV